MNKFNSLITLLLFSAISISQEMETICDDFTSDLWEALDEDTIGYTTDGTEPILGLDWYYHEYYGYSLGSELLFNFNGTEQTVVFNLMDGCGWDPILCVQNITINGTTEVSFGESFPLTIDGFTINLTRDTLLSGVIEIELIIEGELTTIGIDGMETWVKDLCVTRPSTVSLNKEEISRLTLYPNPTTNELQLSTQEQIKVYLIYDVDGKLVASGSYDSIGQKSIDVSTFDNGVYLITIETVDGKTETLQFLKK